MDINILIIIRNITGYYRIYRTLLQDTGYYYRILYRILIIGGSGSGKTNLLLNLIENQPYIDKIYLYANNPYESKYQYLINKRESVGINHFKDPKAFIDYSNDMHDVYKILMITILIKKIKS